MKIVINKCYGGFCPSDAVMEELRKRGKPFERYIVPRNDPDLVDLVESMGAEANGPCSSLKVVEIPDGVNWQLEEYDGIEWIAEVHRTWE